LKLVFLSCSSWVSHPALGGVSIAVVRDGKRFALLDCGPKAPERIHTCGLDPCNLDFVLITHMHGDHVLGLPTLIMWRRFRCYTPTTVVGSKPVIDAVRKLLELTGCPTSRDVELVSLEVGRRYELMGYGITLFESRHSIYSNMARVCLGDTCIAYTSDTSPCEAVVEAARGCKVFIHEASGADPAAMHRIGHSTSLDAVKAAMHSEVQKLILVHPGLEPISVRGSPPNVEIVIPYECYEIELRG